MDEDIKRGLKKIARNTETMLTGSILRWKYKKEGKKIPNNQELEQQSQLITDQAHKIISKRGKNVWNELKKAYKERQKKEGHSD
jgi:hypothetical protein